MSLIQASVQSPFSCDLKYIYNLGSIQDRTKAMAYPQKHQLPPLQEATASAGGGGGTRTSPNSSFGWRPETLGAATAEALWGPYGPG